MEVKTMIAPPNCFIRGCKHYIGIIQADGTEMTEWPACEAYPDGISEEIAYGKDLHLQVRGDQYNNVIYESI